MSFFELGESIPPNTLHAVSVSLPTWEANVGYEEGERWVTERMTTGYPRFFIHRSIQALALEVVSTFGQKGQQAMLFPTLSSANRCVDFIAQLQPSYASQWSIVQLGLSLSRTKSPLIEKLNPGLSAVMLPVEAFPIAKQYWQHTGDGVSSRRAEFCHSLLKEGLLCRISGPRSSTGDSSRAIRGPKRYQRPSLDGVDKAEIKIESPAIANAEESQESLRFLEERFGRNLDLSFVERAKSAIRRRIVGSVVQDAELLAHAQPVKAPNSRGFSNLYEDDVYLFPAGMNAIFHVHRALLAARGNMKSINFGFSYVDTLKILQKFGPGCEFYGHASSAELDDLEALLRSGYRFLALFCEFPGNPLLVSPDLRRIRQLADDYDFVVIVDETIGTFANVNVLPAADIVVSSLTKIFSGDSNVMGGSAILNPNSNYYGLMKRTMDSMYEDTYWSEDAIFMERNSRDFLTRVDRINANAEAICATLQQHPNVKSLFYPKFNPSKKQYDEYKLQARGYGGLLSILFNNKAQAKAFYNAMDSAKGPSLGTNFTLCSPYVLLAHYHELEWAAQFGVMEDLVRISVGLEDTESLRKIFAKALRATQAAISSDSN